MAGAGAPRPDPYFFFLTGVLLTGAAHGETFSPSILAFSVSMVSMNGSLLKSEGTHSQ